MNVNYASIVLFFSIYKGKSIPILFLPLCNQSGPFFFLRPSYSGFEMLSLIWNCSIRLLISLEATLLTFSLHPSSCAPLSFSKNILLPFLRTLSLTSFSIRVDWQKNNEASSEKLQAKRLSPKSGKLRSLGGLELADIWVFQKFTCSGLTSEIDSSHSGVGLWASYVFKAPKVIRMSIPH